MNLEEMFRKAADALALSEDIEALNEKREKLVKDTATLEAVKLELANAQTAIINARQEAGEILIAAEEKAYAITFAAEKNYDDRIEDAKKESQQIRNQYIKDVDKLRKSLRGTEEEFDQRAENAGWPADITPEKIKLVNETAFESMTELIMRGVNDGR